MLNTIYDGFIYALITEEYNLTVCILSIKFRKSDQWFIIHIDMYIFSSANTSVITSNVSS